MWRVDQRPLAAKAEEEAYECLILLMAHPITPSFGKIACREQS
jgi:hypothetical protein